MDTTQWYWNFGESLFRWAHVVAGIVWIGLLYFFNFVNSAFVPTLDADSKKKVVPQLMPRALFWFRWGAAFTWVTGLALLMYVFYYNAYARQGGWEISRPLGALLAVGGIVVAVQLYDVFFKTVFKQPKVAFFAGLVLASAVPVFLKHVVGFGFRGYSIHLGGLFGTIMAFNVWMRIWPAQQKIITAVKNGQKPDDALVALAGVRSKHNTYLSVPLVFTMINAHTDWAAGTEVIPAEASLALVVLVGWLAVTWMYNKAKTVQGF